MSVKHLYIARKMGNKKFLGEVTTPNIITNYRGGGRCCLRVYIRVKCCNIAVLSLYYTYNIKF